MKYELGDCTRRLSLCLLFSVSGRGLRRSTARVCQIVDEVLEGQYRIVSTLTILYMWRVRKNEGRR